MPVKQQMIEWFGPILLEYYAATEGNGCTFITSEDWLAHPGSVGRAVLSDIRILDDDGNECPTGTSGTVWFAGATDFEYFGDPEKTASSRRDDGKTSTVGDVGYLDEDGYLFLTDRKAHMIISGGVNIYPQETENLLVTHPKVLDAAVIGVPNEDLGEEVKAVVQPVEGVAGDDALERELIAFCRDHLAHFKCPRSIDFVERAAPPAHRKALQGRLTGAVLGRSRDPHRVTESGAVALPDDLVSWVEEVGGGRLSVADRRQGGARKEAWYVDLERPDGTVGHLFLRYDRSDPALTKDPWTLHREATVYLALQDSPVPVPRVVGVHPVHQAMLSERVAGENWFSRIADPAEQEETARDFMVQLAALHSLDPGSLDLPAFPAVKTVSDAVHAELDEWERVLVERGGTVDPALAFSLRWLRRNVPGYGGPPVLVQGDTGPGNFMYMGGRVTAVVDWELAHLGDPMDDIAWLSLRATQEPFTDFPTRLREYEALSGNPIDEARVHYYQVMAETKLQVMGHRPDAAGTGAGGNRSAATGGGGDVGNGFIYQMLHRRLWLEALAAATGLALTPAEEPLARDRREHDWMYDAVLSQLRDVIVPRISDPLAAARGKGIARIIKYLAQVDIYGSNYEIARARRPRGAAGPPTRICRGRAGRGRGRRRCGRRQRRALPAPPVAPGGPGDGAGPAIHGSAGRPTLARA